MGTKERYLLGLDIGSTTIRSLIFDKEGMLITEAYRESVVYYPQSGWAEIEPEAWWHSAVEVLRQGLCQSNVPVHKIAGIGICALQHCLIPIDKGGQSLGRAMLWMDQRCKPQVDRIKQEKSDIITRVMGEKIAVSTEMSMPKLRWLVEHEPGLIRQTRYFLPLKDFIRFRLTGTIATDLSDADGTFLLDPSTGDWSPIMLKIAGVSGAQMPPIQKAEHIAGEITPDASRLTGLAAGTPVVTGAGDVTCTRLGANAFDPRRACIYLGTAGWIYNPQKKSRYGSVTPTATTGAALKWLVKLLANNSSELTYSTLLHEAADSPPGAKGLIFLPHMQGERAPRDNPDAKGVFFGLRLAHKRGDLARAVLEGCAFQFKEILNTQNMDGVQEIVVVGGGAKSSLWIDILANVTEYDFLVPEVVEAGALGAALLAGVGVGLYRSVEEAAAQVVRITSRHSVESAKVELYKKIYTVFSALEEKVTPLYAEVPVQHQASRDEQSPNPLDIIGNKKF